MSAEENLPMFGDGASSCNFAGDNLSSESDPPVMRMRLSNLVKTLLSDIQRLSTDIDNNSKLQFSLLLCIRNCTDSIPTAFISIERQNFNEKNTEYSEDYLLSISFTKWIVSTLLKILSSPAVKILHNSCIETLFSIFHLAKKRDVVVFKQLVSPLVKILRRLVVLDGDFENGYCINEYAVLSDKLQKLLGSKCGGNLVERSVWCITSTEASNVFQGNILKLLLQILLDVIQYLPDKINTLWNILCLQLELGNFENKKYAFDIIKDLIDFSESSISKACLTNLINCVQAIFGLYCSGEMHKHNCNGFEKTVASASLKIFGLIKDDKSYILIDKFVLYYALEELITYLIKYGFSQIKEKCLADAIIQNLIVMLQLTEYIKNSVSKLLLENLILKLLASFGETEDPASVTSLFTYIIIQQINNYKFENNNNLMIENKCVNNSRNMQKISDPSKLLTNSQLWLLIQNRSNHLVDKVKSDSKFGTFKDVKKCICGIASCVDIMFQVTSIISYSMDIKNNKLYQLYNYLQPIWDMILLIVYSPTELSSDILEQFIFICDCILNIQDIILLKEQDYNVISIILSIPWIVELNSENIYDLEFHQFSPELKSHWMKLDMSNLCIKTIPALSILPQKISPKWRIHIIQYSLNKENLKSAIINSLASFLCVLGIEYHDVLCNSISLENSSLSMISKLIGKIACIAASTCSLRRLQQSEMEFESAKLHCFCLKCDAKELAANANCSGFLKTWLQNIFVRCIDSSDSNICINTLISFSSFFFHMEVDEKLLEVIMKLLTCENIDVRVSFSENIKYLLMYQKNSFIINPNLAKMLVTNLKTALIAATSKINPQLQLTVLTTIGSIGQVVDDDELLLVSIISLMQGMRSVISNVSLVARTQLQKLAEIRGVKMIDLYKKFKCQLTYSLMDILLEYENNDSVSILNILEFMISPFNFVNVNSFLQNTIRLNIPYLVSKASSSSSNLIKIFAKQLNIPVRQIYVNNFKYIFSYLVCNCSKTELEKALIFSQDETDIELGSLLRYDYQRTHNELLLYLSSHYEQVFNGLIMLATKDKNYNSSNPIIQNEDLAKFLQPRLLGFIAYFDSQLLNSYISLNEKRLALESFICVMELMGPQRITPVRIKVMATLRIALRFTENDFPKTCCKGWKTFIVNVELSSLGTLLNQILATLLPLLKLDPQGVSEIFHFLIVENQIQLNQYFYDLYFIPDLPELNEVNTVLKEYTEKPSNQSDFHSLMAHSLKGVEHENIEVRLYALIKVKQLLQVNQCTLHEHLMGRETVDPLVSRLLSMVMMSCQETDTRIQCLLAEVFGEIGAIDPGRLETVNTGAKNNVHFHSSIEEENFAFDLIQKLVHSFLAAEESRTQDCSSYAIQELLQIYQCNDISNPPSSGNNLWKRFPIDVQEILSPLLRSKYIPGQSKSGKNIQKPIYGSSFGDTFKHWVTNWIADLVVKIHTETVSKVFHSCLMIVKYDTSCALYLLPYVVMYVIREATDNEREELYTEVITVLKHCEQLHPQKSIEVQCHLSAQTVFSVLDYLNRWVHHQQSLSVLNTRKNCSNKNLLPGFSQVKEFINRIPQDLLAQASFKCNAFARALMYLELHIRSNPKELQKMLGFLQKLYFSLDEPDGVSGISAIRQDEPTLEEQILEYEIAGQMQEAFACYERAVRLHPDDHSHHLGLLHCLMRLDQPDTALKYATGLLENKSEWKNDIASYQVEAAWKLANWDNLKSFLDVHKSVDHWNVGIGKILLAGKEKDSDAFWKELNQVRSKQMGPLSAAAMEDGGYQRGYQYLTRLHMLTDLETGLKAFLSLPEKEQSLSGKILDVEKVLEEWKTRRQLTQASLRYKEPILSLQRSLLTIAETEHRELNEKINQEKGLCWLESAKLARKCGHLQRAFSCLLDASSYNLPQVFLEKAKWHWNKGEQEQAINTLQKGIQEYFSDTIALKCEESLNSLEMQLTCAKAKLMLARYSEESALVESNSLLQMYQEIVNINPNWEDSYFYLAKYFDRVLNSIEKLDRKIELAGKVIKNFGLSLQFGCKHVYHSMPRLLSLWFELGSQIGDSKKNRHSSSFTQSEIALSHLTNKIVVTLVDKLPLFLFMTAFPQLISRICHPHQGIVNQLQRIISKLLVAYPQQSMWMMIAVSKSSYPMRVQRCREIFSLAKKIQPDLTKFISDSISLTEKLVELCNKSVNDTSLSIKSNLSTLPRLLSDGSFSKIMLPLQSLMTITLPTTDFSLQTDYNPFPKSPVYIVEFLDKVEILTSLQKPKKVTIRGSDGKLYVMMCKPKDDLRKDCRLMEFNNLVNRFLKKDAESRKRQLYIRTYTVVPLNEECGLIEWIPNLSGLRRILNNIYKEHKLFTTSDEIRKWMPQLSMTLEQKLSIFKTKFLPHYPPMFAHWFLKTFPDPTAWYMARLSYARTTAVMSTVGYILGLGDRHGENILFDSSCGDTVHVDFNCLFNKGETFDWPEKVPFRLTHNMIDAMGPTGYEGIYRKACEVTMRLMRTQTDSLMSVLKPFIHDPLVEWSKPMVGSSKPETGEIHVQNIEQRLKGIVKSKNKPQLLPLSVEGQVNYLIMEATDERNLCQMYVGWAAYM
ncbi:serine/threonine-protein kinase ATR-like [Centruroides sculpturatus]|uniref:serine/threonine-protein kinase ATR-like n=1 Tax=Centruroides sculpturatus TaxID=218467 RepID=UPI000C6EB5CA|nr:serine/threonine-protein kinase ATR-like [Centruroides sculpturatus]